MYVNVKIHFPLPKPVTYRTLTSSIRLADRDLWDFEMRRNYSQTSPC